ncbi:MAG TPA: choice-of-anchor B family protein [Pyrinomonadaceae bacterium]|nr:choice-of-anchor B family protein [Pyrinomonadaceae bacterium]
MFFLASKKIQIGLLLSAFLVIGLLISVRAHDGEEHPHGGGPNGQPNEQALVAMGKTPCVGGMAGTFPCRNVDLASFLPLAAIGGGTVNDVWGWTDPLTDKEYALVGRSNGTAFVDISNPEHPIYLGNLPTHSIDSVWRGLKVYADHAFIISEAAGHGMQVFDLTRLRNVANAPVTFTEDAHYNGFGRAHTLAINEATGFAYAAGVRDSSCISGLHIVDVRSPKTPVYAGCSNQDGYTHEAQCVSYRGPDSAYVGREVCFNSNEDTLTIVDVTNKSAPVQLSRTTYQGVGYTHQGWLTEDQKHFLLDDELDEQKAGTNSSTYIWDVSDLDAPVLKGVYSGPSKAIDHNLYIRGNRAYESNYRSGLRILDISNVGTASLSEVGFFDIYPIDDLPQFNGAWSNYPFFRSGIVIVGGIEQGLFVLRPRTAADSAVPFQMVLDQSGPDPQQAAALDAMLLYRDPFPVVNTTNLLNTGTDKNTRVMLFMADLYLAEGEAASSVKVSLVDSSNQVFEVAAEAVRPNFDFVQVVFRLPDNLAPGKCTVKVKAHGQESNAGTIRIKS